MPQVEFIIDASVAVKWFSRKDESDLEKALKLQMMHLVRECSLAAPELIVYEVANALRHNRNLSAMDVKLAIASISGLQMELIGDAEFLATAVDLAYEKGLTIYDAAYVALAIARRSIFVSADGKILRKLAGLPNVVHLRDLRL